MLLAILEWSCSMIAITVHVETIRWKGLWITSKISSSHDRSHSHSCFGSAMCMRWRGKLEAMCRKLGNAKVVTSMDVMKQALGRGNAYIMSNPVFDGKRENDVV